MRLLNYIFIVSLILFTSAVTAGVIRVPQDQSTIQAGIDAAIDGDTVLVDTGRYVENINFNGMNIVVGSQFLTTRDTSYISQTVIDGDSSGSVATFENGEDSTAVLTGFTLTNGLALWGGGILCDASSTPSLVGLNVTRNRASGGGGIYCYESSPTLVDITVSGNIADAIGGGISCTNSHPSLQNVRVNGNVAHHGGALFCELSNPNLRNVTIIGNTAGSGGAIHSLSSSPTLVNVTISRNTAEVGSGIWCWLNSRPRLVNTILWNESGEEIYFVQSGEPNSITIAYSDVFGGESGIATNDNGTVNWFDGNVDRDPLFVDAENGDFHLQQGSPCIDAGTAFFVFDGDTLVDLPASSYEGYAPDMGSYESPYSVGITDESILAIQFALKHPHPNPFNPTTTIEFYTPQSGQVILTINDLLGREVGTILKKRMDAGHHKVQWNATNVPSGIYFVKMQTGSFSLVKKVTVLR
ncbi:MAG: T9SS type A sorting domain-containing protein [Candidatus Neomarinimicrobiota bacterium]